MPNAVPTGRCLDWELVEFTTDFTDRTKCYRPTLPPTPAPVADTGIGAAGITSIAVGGVTAAAALARAATTFTTTAQATSAAV